MNDAPLAGRLRRPGWTDPRLLIGLLLIVVSVVAVTAMVRSADVTTPYYVAKRTLTPGTVLSERDVVVGHARLSSGDYMKPADAPWGQVVTRVVGAGELIPTSAAGDATSFGGRTVAVQTTLPLADGVKPGSVVDVYVTAEGPDGRAETQRVGTSLVVESIDRSSGSFSAMSVETVYVVVPREDIEELLSALASRADISVVGVAGGVA